MEKTVPTRALFFFDIQQARVWLFQQVSLQSSPTCPRLVFLIPRRFGGLDFLCWFCTLPLGLMMSE